MERGEEMKLRDVTAIMGGMLSEIATLAVLLMWTDMGLGGIMFISVLAYIFAWAGVMWATEPKKVPARQHNSPQIYTLNKTAYYSLEEDTNESKVG